MKILSQQPWDTVVDFMVRYPDSPEEAKALGHVIWLLRDAIHEKRWWPNRMMIREILHQYDWGYMWRETPELIAEALNEIVYGDDDDA